MWTLGCIIFNMATGVPPFYVESNKQTDLHQCIRKADWKTQFKPFAKICSAKLGDILDKCLDPNPNTRMSARDAVLHPFFKITRNDYKDLRKEKDRV